MSTSEDESDSNEGGSGATGLAGPKRPADTTMAHSTAPARAIVNTVTDWKGRVVVLRATRLAHIAEQRIELVAFVPAIMAVAASPE